MSVTVRFALVALLAGGGKNGDAEPSWEKLYDLGAAENWLSSLHAEGDQWFAGGKEILIKGGPAGASPEAHPGKTILGLSSTPNGLFALGADQLILRLDGKAWNEEHFTAPPARPTARTKYAAILHSADALGTEEAAPLVAYGPRGVLIREPDGSWVAPAEPERARLSRLAQQGPRKLVPPKCAPYGWHWLPADRGWLTCHGGRTFVIENSGARATGSLPKVCADGGEGLAERGSELYTLCAGRLWKSGAGRWTAVPAPADLRALAATPRCLFVASERAVWRSCSSRQAPLPSRRARRPPL
jgi:hypothetical protein